MVISVDFDGTCVTHEYPKVGKDIGAEIVLKALTKAGHDIICTTMRSQMDKDNWNVDTVSEAKKWFSGNDIKLYGFNENPSQAEWSDSRKIYANTYIDDQFLGCPLSYNKSYSKRAFVDWYRVCIYLEIQGLLSHDESERVMEEIVKKYPNIYNNLTHN